MKVNEEKEAGDSLIGKWSWTLLRANQLNFLSAPCWVRVRSTGNQTWLPIVISAAVTLSRDYQLFCYCPSFRLHFHFPSFSCLWFKLTNTTSSMMGCTNSGRTWNHAIASSARRRNLTDFTNVSVSTRRTYDSWLAFCGYKYKRTSEMVWLSCSPTSLRWCISSSPSSAVASLSSFSSNVPAIRLFGLFPFLSGIILINIFSSRVVFHMEKGTAM